MTVKSTTSNWTDTTLLDVTAKAQDTTPLKWEDNFTFWEARCKTVDIEPVYESYH